MGGFNPTPKVGGAVFDFVNAPIFLFPSGFATSFSPYIFFWKLIFILAFPGHVWSMRCFFFFPFLCRALRGVLTPHL